MRLSARSLNRTLLLRQHLLERVSTTVEAEARHLVGLQAQETLAPYLSLAARLEALDPYDVTRGLEDRTLVRLLTMRGTVHLLPAADAALRGWTQPVHERELKASGHVGSARDLDREVAAAAVREVLADGPLSVKDLGLALAERFPDHTGTQLGNLARSLVPLAQLPPRGTWKGTGGVVYDLAERWSGVPIGPPTTSYVEETVRRYLRAFGPATAADVTAWSGITRLGPVVAAMADLVRHQDESGRPLLDVPEGQIADEDTQAPVRLLGRYDNVWLSHAGRDRVTTPEGRAAWSGPNGGIANTLFVDGWLTGTWTVEDGRVRVLETLRSLSRAEKTGLDDEIGRIETLLGA